MSRRAVWVVALAVAWAVGCAAIAPKRRIEPHERVAVEIRKATNAGRTAGVGLPETDTTACLEGDPGNVEFARPICSAIGPILASGLAADAAVGELNAALARLVGERGLETRFAAIVSSRLARRRSVAPTPERADVLLALYLHGLGVELRDEGNVALRITAAARVETGGEDPRKPRTAWRATELATRPRPFRDWVDSDGRSLLEDLDAGLAQIADDAIAGAMQGGKRPAPRD